MMPQEARFDLLNAAKSTSRARGLPETTLWTYNHSFMVIRFATRPTVNP